jgi:SAM-dependent methyltransferase
LVDDTFFCASGSWTMMRCKGCQATYLDPRPSESAIHLAYKTYYTHARQAAPQGLRATLGRALDNTHRNLIFGTAFRPSLPLPNLLGHLMRHRVGRRVQQSDRGLARLSQRGAVLDVGCGNGAFLSFVRALGWHPFGVEADLSAANVATEAGINVLARTLTELDGKYDNFFDAITLSHVIEHLHQPNQDILRCFSLLKPGGYLWIETPNIDSYGFKLFGRYWRGLEAPRHLVLFNEGSLGALLRRAGFNAVQRLQIHDPAPNLFRRSTMMRAGFAPEADVRKLSLAARVQLRAAVYESKLQTAKNPSCAEYLCMCANKPARF